MKKGGNEGMVYEFDDSNYEYEDVIYEYKD